MKSFLKNKLASGALQFTVFISVIVAILLAGALLLAYTHRFFIEQSKDIINNVQLADTGITALLSDGNISPDTLLIDVPNAPESQTVSTQLSHWGIFEKAFVKATQRKKTFIKCALLGTGLKSTARPSLYLQETYKPLAVIGTTRIEGTAYLPQEGVRPGNISGNSYYGTDLIYGNTEKSAPELPKLKYDTKHLDYYLNEYEPKKPASYISIDPGTVSKNSFNDPVKGTFSKSPIILKDISLQGNIIIRSEEKITITKTAYLKDVILSAPIIIIEDNVVGNFQAIANMTIKTGVNCTLQYPSALVLKKENAMKLSDDEFFNKIFMGKNTVIRGSICYFGTLAERDYKVNIFISPESSIKGEIYCTGNLELRGKVAGTVYTNQFVTNESGTIFVNHLYNAQIISADLPEAFAGILLDKESKSLLKWLY